LKKKIGSEAIKEVPFGAIAAWTLADKLAAGLQQLLAGARKFSIQDISRRDIVSANRETERETSVPFITDVQDDMARKLLVDPALQYVMDAQDDAARNKLVS
ncbi:MAG: hypothetical protein ACOCVM_06875, partial [Desulfovibrionaceae bacterium]